MVAVAHRRDGPSSSATISTVDRALPSSAVQLRCWSLPTTTTRLPFDSDCAACSAWSRHTITFTVLRRARVAFAKRRRAKDGVPLDAWGRPEDDQAVIFVATWVYVGAGYATEGERWLALSAAARAREHRRIAREELTTTTPSAPA